VHSHLAVISGSINRSAGKFFILLTAALLLKFTVNVFTNEWNGYGPKESVFQYENEVAFLRSGVPLAPAVVGWVMSICNSS
jgi:hypothetical protein